MFVCVPRVVRPGLVGLVGLLAALTVVGCSASSNDDQPAPAGQPPSVQSPVADQPLNPAEKAQADTDVAKDLALKENLDSRFADYLEANAQATDLAVFEGSDLMRKYATKNQVDRLLGFYAEYRKRGQVQISSPEFVSHFKEANGEKAQLYACMDLRPAKALVKKTQKTISANLEEKEAWVVEFVRNVSDVWLVNEITNQDDEAAQKCA